MNKPVRSRARTCVSLGTVLARGAGGTGSSCGAGRARGSWLLGHLHKVVNIGIQAGNLLIKFLVSRSLQIEHESAFRKLGRVKIETCKAQGSCVYLHSLSTHKMVAKFLQILETKHFVTTAEKVRSQCQ
jgi:hypothetical protein